MFIYNGYIRLSLLFIIVLGALALLGQSTANTAFASSQICDTTPQIQWLYEQNGIGLTLNVTTRCFKQGRQITQSGSVDWQCVQVGSSDVTTQGTALVFNGNSGLRCNGETVQSIVKRLTDIEVYHAVPAHHFYVQAHIQPFTGDEPCAQAYRGGVDTYQSYLPLFDDGNINYRLDRSSTNTEFALRMTIDWAYKNRQPVGHTFYSQKFTPPSLLRSTYENEQMTHLLDNNPLSQDPPTGKDFFLLINTEEIKVGYDDAGNYFCGYIIDLEVDPIDPGGLGTITID